MWAFLYSNWLQTLRHKFMHSFTILELLEDGQAEVYLADANFVYAVDPATKSEFVLFESEEITRVKSYFDRLQTTRSIVRIEISGRQDLKTACQLVKRVVGSCQLDERYQ